MPISSPLPHSPQWKTRSLRMRRPSPLQCMAAQLASCLYVGVSIWGTSACSQLAAHPPKPSQTSLTHIQGNPWRPTSQPPSTLFPLPLCHLFNVVAWTWVIGNLAEWKRAWSQVSRKHKKLIYYFSPPFPWLSPNTFTSYVLCSLNGLPSALEQNDPDNYPQQYRWFPQRCGNDVLNTQSPKGDEDVHETSSL